MIPSSLLTYLENVMWTPTPENSITVVPHVTRPI